MSPGPASESNPRLTINLIGVDCATDPKNVGYAFGSYASMSRLWHLFGSLCEPNRAAFRVTANELPSLRGGCPSSPRTRHHFEINGSKADFRRVIKGVGECLSGLTR